MSVCAVRRRLGHEGGADGVAGAGAVLDDHVAAELRAELGVDRAGEDVLDPARGERHHDARDLPCPWPARAAQHSAAANKKSRQLLLPLLFAAGLAASCGQ